ncbi:MAG: DNA internalization-related competence protein ComEC/Rec2 [Mogibacterium sp.]|nr:DNA internalization-related competence protein ComEC/Rec2 [Mogibacterium sp.]
MEKNNPAGGILMLLATGITVCLMIRQISRDAPAGAISQRPSGTSLKEIICLIAALLAGFMLFTIRFILYESESAVLRSFSGEEAILLEGRVTSARTKENSFDIELGDVTIQDGGSAKLKNKILVKFDGNIVNGSEPVDIADLTGLRVEIKGKLIEPDSADNPGCFDYRLYLRSCRTVYMIKTSSVNYERDRDGSFPGEIYWKWRRLLVRKREAFLGMFSDETIRGFIKGVVFGDKNDIGEEIREEFNTNNTGHILAVSGLHIGFLYALLRFFSGKRRSVLISLAIVSAIIIYGEMTLWSASTIRAVIVLSISMLSFYVRRPADLLTSVSAAAVIILISNPYQLFNTGFQMSFLALMGIAFLGGPLAAFMGEGFGIMLAVQLGAAPLAAFYFHRFNPLSVLINIPIIAVASILVPLCIMTLLLSSVSGTLFLGGGAGVTDIAVRLSEYAAHFTIWLNRIIAGDGSFSFNAVSVSPGLILLFYLLIFFMCCEWTRIMILRKEWELITVGLACILIVSTAMGIASYNKFADDEIVFVSVGQGDCTHIRCNGHDVLIDGGGRTDYNVGKKILMPYLLSNGAEKVDFAMVTHLHTDHCLGILELDIEYPVGMIGIPDDYRRSIERTSDSKYSYRTVPATDGAGDIEEIVKQCDNLLFLSSGERITVSENVFIDPVWPPPGVKRNLSADDPNENNMVYIVNYKGVKIMVTGDLLEEDEHEMVKYYAGTNALDCDVLKVAHHGSKSSSSEEFLDAVDPEIAVIQVGRNNLYGHPHQQTLARLEERGIKVFRTDLNGAVGIDLKKQGIKIDIMKADDRPKKKN